MYVLAVLDRKRRLLTGDILPSLSNSLLLLSSNIALDVYHKKTESWKDIDVRLFHTQLSASSHIFFSKDNIGYVCIFLWWPKPIIDYHYWQWSVEEKNIYSLQKYIGFVRWNDEMFLQKHLQILECENQFILFLIQGKNQVMKKRKRIHTLS